MFRSQAGPNAGVALSTCPCSPLSRIESPLFRVLLQRRLSLPLPLSNRICRCGLPNDQIGCHRATCSRTGLLGGRGFLLESSSKICREAGQRVATNRFLCEHVPWSSECCTTVVWRLWSMDSHSVESNWQWTRHFCQQSRATEFLGGKPTEMAWPSRVRAGRRQGPSLSLWQQVLGFVWWCWPWRWAEDGPRRPARLSSCLPRPR